ncbi:MAG: hypothetical protein H7Z21_02700 [Hymenobacter sp.]|nr:hypothetical protein [Hymenobacter sp.]
MHILRYLFFAAILLGFVACKKGDPTPATPALITDGSLLGLWDEKESRGRYYNSSGQLLRDEVNVVEKPNYRYEVIFDASTIRYRSYAGSTMTSDSAYTYTRKGLMLSIGDQPVQETKILELSNQRLTLEYRSNRPSGFYYIVEDRYTR